MVFTLSLKLLCLSFLVNYSESLDIESDRSNLAIKMLSYMDTEADPCQDFYQYACGNYSKVTKGYEGGNWQSILKTSELNYQEILGELLMEPLSEDHDQNAADQARIYYQSCMNEPIFNFEKSEEYLNFIKEEFKGLFDFIPRDYDWTNALVKAKLYFGIDLFFKFNENFDDECFDVNVDLYDLNLKSFVSNSAKVNKDIIKRIMKIYDRFDSEIKMTIKQIESFQNNIEKLRTRNSENSKKSISDEELSYTGYNANDMDIPKNLKEYSVLAHTTNKNLEFRVCNYEHFNKFVKAIKRYRKSVAKYVTIKILVALHLKEFESPKNQKSFCVDTVKDVMKPVVNAIYFNSTHFDSDVETEGKSMINYLRKGFEDYIDTSDWLDEQTKAAADAKIKTMDITFSAITNFDEIFNDEKYLSLNFTKNKFHENRIKALKFHKTERTYAYNRWAKNQDELKMDGSYYYNTNSVFIPAGLLKPPFINTNLPKSYNYAALGFFIAHEMTHSLDNHGRQFNENGRLHNWWGQESEQEFDRRAQCFVEQFSSYRVDYTNASLDGNKALSENIADCGGIRRAFDGYNKWYKENENDIDSERETIPGVTNIELFFLSFAQLFCSEVKGMIYHHMSYQDHSVDKFRVIGSLANLNEFADAFSCEIGTVLNRESKCVLW